MRKLKQGALISTVFMLSIIVAVLYLDRPLALFMHNSEFDQLFQLRYITEKLPDIMAGGIIIAIILSKTIFAWPQKIIMAIYFYVALYISMQIKDLLKIFFGRYWPKTWIQNNLSLINNNVYGFNFLHGSAMVGAFPSGHSACTAFCVMWLIRLLPKCQSGFILIGMMVPISLIILDYHFLGDCLAGIILGGDLAAISIILYNFLIKISFIKYCCH